MKKAVVFLLIGALGAWCQNPELLVLLKGANALAFYTWAGELVASAPVGTHPHEMVQSPDGRFAYVTDNGTMRIEHAGAGGNTVSIVDIAKQRLAARISLGKYHRPHGIDLDPATNRLVVTAENPDRLLLLNAETRSVIRTYDTKGETPHMVKLGPDGEWAYVSNSRSGNVAAINLASGEVKLIPAGERPEGGDLSPDGKVLYITNRESASITIIDTGSQSRIGEIKTSRGPVRLEVAPDGTLVYAAMHDKKVEFADPKTRQVTGSADLDGTPISLHLSDDGKYAFVGAEEQDTVYIVSVAEKTIVQTIKTDPGAGPDPVQLIRGAR